MLVRTHINARNRLSLTLNAMESYVDVTLIKLGLSRGFNINTFSAQNRIFGQSIVAGYWFGLIVLVAPNSAYLS